MRLGEAPNSVKGDQIDSGGPRKKPRSLNTEKYRGVSRLHVAKWGMGRQAKAEANLQSTSFQHEQPEVCIVEAMPEKHHA